MIEASTLVVSFSVLPFSRRFSSAFVIVASSFFGSSWEARACVDGCDGGGRAHEAAGREAGA